MFNLFNIFVAIKIIMVFWLTKYMYFHNIIAFGGYWMKENMCNSTHRLQVLLEDLPVSYKNGYVPLVMDKIFGALTFYTCIVSLADDTPHQRTRGSGR